MDPNNIPFARSMPLRARMEPASGSMDATDQQGDQTGASQRMMADSRTAGPTLTAQSLLPSLADRAVQYSASPW